MANEKTAEPKTTTAPKKATAKKKTSKAKKASSPKTTKTSKKPEFGAKSKFIKAQPATMTAKEVVAAAKAKGITLSENLVYAARAGAKKNGGAGKKAKKGAKKAKPGPRPKKAATSKGSGSLEATLRNAIAQIGLNRAKEIFEHVRLAFEG